jgi:hypothetical protein
VVATNLVAVANRLFDDFLAPLVLGGEVRPGRPIGARAALALGRNQTPIDMDRVAHVELARTRTARRLVPVDRAERATEAEWALAAALHDLVQTAHPGFDAVFRRGGPPRLLDLVNLTLERVPSPSSLGEALARHTWFARMFEMVRIDTVVHWWVGSRTFLGVEPPPRLSAWPELRRVHVDKSPRSIMDLPGAGAAVDLRRFSDALTRFLAKTPLTDLATCHRTAPAFVWSRESLGLVGTDAGRTLAARALFLSLDGSSTDGPSPLPSDRGQSQRALRGLHNAAIDAGLGRATRALVSARAWRAAAIALDLLAERALSEATLALWRGDTPPSAKDATDDAGYARCAGALVAWEKLRSGGGGFGESDRAELVSRLAPFANAPQARALAGELAALS